MAYVNDHLIRAFKLFAWVDPICLCLGPFRFCNLLLDHYAYIFFFNDKGKQCPLTYQLYALFQINACWIQHYPMALV